MDLLDLQIEKTRKLSTQDIYDILTFATSAAEDNGFMNSFVFYRALYEYAALLMVPEQKDEYVPVVAKNINEAWDKMLEDGILDKITEEFPTELDILVSNGEVWLQEYTQYAHSMRGLLDTIQTVSGDIVKNAANVFQQSVDNADLQNVIKIADNWGMNNSFDDVETEASVSSDSIFE